jgi:FkbM family methyltransferase
MQAQHAALCRNLDKEDDSGISERIQLGVGAGDEEEVQFAYYPQCPGNSSAKIEEKQAQLAKCMAPELRAQGAIETHAVRSLHTVFKEFGVKQVGLVKVDCEGVSVGIILHTAELMRA